MIVSDSISVAAGATTANVLQGFAEALLNRPSLVSVRVNVDGAAARTDIRTRYDAGVTPKTGRNGSPTNVAATTGILDPRTDTMLSRMAVIGQQSLTFTNTTAGALVVNWEYELHEV